MLNPRFSTLLFTGLQVKQGRRCRYSIGLTYLMLLLTGCIAVPERSPDAVPLPADFPANGTVKLPGRWWESFGDATLDRLIEQSLANNFTLQSVWARLDQAAAMERISRAELYPSVDAEGSASRSWAHDDRGVTGNSYAVGAMASYELDLWGRINSNSKAASLDRRATEAELTAAAISLSAEVASTWYQLVEQYGQQALVSSQLDTNSRVLELITLRFRRGKVGATDVLQQRQLVESNRGELARVQALIGELEHRLAILLGATPDSRAAAPQQQLISLPPLPETGIPIELIQRRPDLRQGFYQLQAADQRTAAAVADRFPRISLLASSDTTSSDVDDLFDHWLSNLTGNLLAPVIDGGRRRAEVDHRRAVAEQSLSDYRQQLLDALGEVEDALLREQQQRAFINSLDKQLALSKQVIGRVRDSYLYGVVDYLRVLDVLITNQNLERSRLTAQRQLIDDRIALCRALAGGWTLERPAVPGELPTTRITHVYSE
jgi:NodT family efflux transporter outer membrane factor (OMF) lipoprotein